MNKLMELFHSATKWQEKFIKWNETWALPMSVFFGIFVAGIIGVILGINPSTLAVDTLSFWIITLSSGGVSSIILLVTMHALGVRLATKHTELSKNAQELEFFRRAGDKLGSFMFFVSGSNFDKALDWFHQGNSRSLNMVVAKVIQEQLDRGFRPTSIRIPINTYADHSNILARLLPMTQNLCLTIIKSPRDWFMDLDIDSVDHKILPEYLGGSFNTPLDGYSPERASQYPTHFIHFLEYSGDDIRRRRVFLLDGPQWESLIETAHIGFLDKFMDPCRNLVETRFVRVEEFKRIVTARSQSEDQEPVLEAIEQNVLLKDYDIFEDKAMLVYEPGIPNEKDPSIYDRSPVLEFHVGERVINYATLIDLIFGKFDSNYYVYTEEEVRNLIRRAE